MPTEAVEVTANQGTPIIQILAMPDSKARATALQQRQESERALLLKNDHALDGADPSTLTDSTLVRQVSEGKLEPDAYISEMLLRQNAINPNINTKFAKKNIEKNLEVSKIAYEKQKAVNSLLDKVQTGAVLSEDEQKLLNDYYPENSPEPPAFQRPFQEIQDEIQQLTTKLQGSKKLTRDEYRRLDQLLRSSQPMELRVLKEQGIITEDQLKDQLSKWKSENVSQGVKNRGPSTQTSSSSQSGSFAALAESATGVQILRRNFTPQQARAYVATLPLEHQRGLNAELDRLEASGLRYTVSVRRDGRGAYGLEQFILQPTNTWTNVKKNAEQSVTQSVRHEVGKQGNRLINPDYVHNEMINQYKLVRDALPPGTTTHKLLEKTDKIVTVALTGTGLTMEAVNLLVNAVRGALLEAPELQYKVAALIPDDLVRQGVTVNTRLLGNNLRAFIHKKYNLPDRPRHTPILVNTLEQIKPEHYRAQDAQKVGITMRDLSREKAIKFIHDNVPLEKQQSAIETLGRLEGNQFGVSIMDSGWVRIDASAREPRKYEDRPQYDNRQK